MPLAVFFCIDFPYYHPCFGCTEVLKCFWRYFPYLHFFWTRYPYLASTWHLNPFLKIMPISRLAIGSDSGNQKTVVREMQELMVERLCLTKEMR